MEAGGQIFLFPNLECVPGASLGVPSFCSKACKSVCRKSISGTIGGVENERKHRTIYQVLPFAQKNVPQTPDV